VGSFKILQNHWANFNRIWHKSSSDRGDSSLFKISRTSTPNSIKLNTNYTWVKGIQVYSNKGPCPLQRGDYHKNLKVGWGHLKIFFSRTTGPSLTRLGTNHLWGSEFKFVLMKGFALLQGEVTVKK
jgi:hypothetical protein